MVIVLVAAEGGEEIMAAVEGDETTTAAESCRIWSRAAEALFAGGKSRR
jgi:hypothetical protein